MRKYFLVSFALIFALFACEEIAQQNGENNQGNTNKKFVVAEMKGGSFSIPKKGEIRAALTKDLGKVEIGDMSIAQADSGDIKYFLQVETRTKRGRTVLRFPLEDMNGILGVRPLPGQKCSGDPCEACGFRESGWGCRCVDGGDDGYCKHEATSLDEFSTFYKTVGMEG